MSSLAAARTDVVGSLLRPARWKEARLRLDSGLMGRESFATLELDCVKKNLELQEDAGLDVVTDGEISRLNFQDSFGLSVSGYASGSSESIGSQENRSAGGTPLSRWEIPDLAGPGTPVIHRRPVRQRLQLTRNVPLEEYLRVAPLAKRPVKVTLIGPDRVAQRFDREGSKGVYSGMDDFVQDVVAIQRRMIGQLVDAGCRYVHIDAPGYTAYVDEPSLAAMRARGEDPWQNFARSLKADAALIEGFPGVTFGIHLCRGNQRSMWHREGSYDAIAERLFNELPHERFLLEYDSPRAGGFAPLRFVPKGKIVVLGLVSTKVPRLEPVDELKRRIDEAAKFVPLANLALSPQCGFGSDVVGNLVSEDDQKRKLERVVETARQVWR
ncbi:MAG: cobalamin-independent methionine synthase II family protein [Betaproteobacteria bacterium]|nr:MAG: cobalamin-independent methionine synthase II family protein [Betaproteobacteria bacterium]